MSLQVTLVFSWCPLPPHTSPVYPSPFLCCTLIWGEPYDRLVSAKQVVSSNLLHPSFQSPLTSKHQQPHSLLSTPTTPNYFSPKNVLALIKHPKIKEGCCFGLCSTVFILEVGSDLNLLWLSTTINHVVGGKKNDYYVLEVIQILNNRKKTVSATHIAMQKSEVLYNTACDWKQNTGAGILESDMMNGGQHIWLMVCCCLCSQNHNVQLVNEFSLVVLGTPWFHCIHCGKLGDNTLSMLLNSNNNNTPFHHPLLIATCKESLHILP
ncbi:hypothetical protein VP01_631g2 [Puccinia sorghi]|uniref:Uncharacterized protein n=1 Tax=Puccinia sorghi TaxID=27349 RepID=A0A0L6UG92_9BASI|nr:hypothetical protein VP01_631g2 [Puccinia sorghi]